jgi:phosphohistidine swiveling domain-containing protein
MSYSAMASAMSAMPGFRIETLLLMFGDSPQLAPLIAYRPGGRRYFLLRLPATLVRSVAWLLFAERYIDRAREVADRFEQHVRSTLVGNPTDAQLLELLRSVQTWDSTPIDAMSVSTSMANRLLGTLMSTRAGTDQTSRVDAATLAVTDRRLLALPPSSRLLAELPVGRLVPFALEPNGEALGGCGASPGRATGRARGVREFGEIHSLEPGEILVTRTTDIGWTPLFRLASAIVTEIGAPTSHAAIVARELGLPAVVNVDRVTERVCTGDVLFVDGWAGLVRFVYKGSSSTNSPWTSVMSGKANESHYRSVP